MKRPIIDYHNNSDWASSGNVIGTIDLKEGFYFTQDTDGCIDAPMATPSGCTVKNIIHPRDRRRRPVHAIIPGLSWRD